MAYKLGFRFHPQAEQDFDEALEYYKDISPTLSKDFYNEFYRNIRIALDHPELFPSRYNCRKINLTRFPYLIFYQVIDSSLVVIAVFHGYRNPKTIRSQIKNR